MGKYVNAYRVAVLIAVLLLLVGGYTVISYPTLPHAVTTYEYPLITTNDKPLCPDDKVIYDQVSRITNAPIMLEVVESIWSVEQNKTVLPDYHPFKVNIPPGFVGARSHLEWLVPELPAGHYKLLRSTTAPGRQSEMFVVTFEIAKGC